MFVMWWSWTVIHRSTQTVLPCSQYSQYSPDIQSQGLHFLSKCQNSFLVSYFHIFVCIFHFCLHSSRPSNAFLSSDSHQAIGISGKHGSARTESLHQLYYLSSQASERAGIWPEIHQVSLLEDAKPTPPTHRFLHTSIKSMAVVPFT